MWTGGRSGGYLGLRRARRRLAIALMGLVAVKSFVGRSFVTDLQAAIGQYAMYQSVIDERRLEFRLYLAITSTVYEEMMAP